MAIREVLIDPEEYKMKKGSSDNVAFPLVERKRVVSHRDVKREVNTEKSHILSTNKAGYEAGRADRNKELERLQALVSSGDKAVLVELKRLQHEAHLDNLARKRAIKKAPNEAVLAIKRKEKEELEIARQAALDRAAQKKPAE